MNMPTPVTEPTMAPMTRLSRMATMMITAV